MPPAAPDSAAPFSQALANALNNADTLNDSTALTPPGYGQAFVDALNEAARGAMDAAFKEDDHKRDDSGKFTSGGGGGGKSDFDVITRPDPARPSLSSRAAGTTARVLKNYTKEDYHVLKEHLSPDSEARRSLGRKVLDYSKTLPSLLKTHGKEELHKAKHAAGALKALSTGNKPSTEQMKGLAALTFSVMMSAATMLTHGDPTGAAGHAAAHAASAAIAHLAQEFGAELAVHTAMEHGAKATAGAARYGLAKAGFGGGDDAAFDPDGPANGDDVELDDDEIKLLQAFLEQLAETVVSYEIPDDKLRDSLPEPPANDRVMIRRPGAEVASPRPFGRPSGARDAEFKESDVKRDEGGKFATQAGSGSESGPSERAAPDPASKSKPSPGTKTADKAREACQARVDKIVTEYESAGVEMSDKEFFGGGAKQKALADVAEVMYDFMGVSQADVPVTVVPTHDFKVGDKTYQSGGTYYGNDNRIEITDINDPATVGGVASHELMHAKYHAVREAYHAEGEAIAALTRNDDVDIDDIMSPNGRIKEAYQDQFPVHTVMPDGFGSYTDLKRDDGITDYSRAWWAAANEGKADGETAVNETLAEMASLDWQGVLPRLLWFKQSKVYKPIYQAIHQAYPKVMAAAKAEAASGGKFSTNLSALQASMRELGFTEFHRLEDKGLLIVGYEPPRTGQPPYNDFAVTINPHTNSWTGTWGRNRTRFEGKGYASLKTAFDKFKRGVDPD